MNTKGLRRAYATLGLDERASLDDARVAYLTWVSLLVDPPSRLHPDPDAVADATAGDLAHHELDLAWHAIEQAHRHGIVLGCRPRGCPDCGATPAVRVTTHARQPGRVRAQVVTTTSLRCRDCGLGAARATRRAAARTGWWGMPAAVANVRALSRNSTEITSLRRVTPGTPRQRSTPVPVGNAAQRRPRGSAGHRLAGWTAGLMAVALAVGIALPTGSAGSPERSGKSGVHSARVVPGSPAQAAERAPAPPTD